MADPNFLTREFAIEIRPASVLLNRLIEMKKLADKTIGYELPTTTKASLIVTHYNTIQIFTRFPKLGACAILDMESDSITAPSNSDGYSLQFNIETWIQALSNHVSQEPAASLLLKKSPASMDLSCIYGAEKESIGLGEAEFTKQATIKVDSLRCCVRVTMRSGEFREFIKDLAITPTRFMKHDIRASALQMQITSSTIRWPTPSGYYDHPAQSFSIEGLKPGAAFRFPLRWHLPLLRFCRFVSHENDRVELSVYLNTRGEKYNRIQFLRDNVRHSFYYLEDEPLPPQ